MKISCKIIQPPIKVRQESETEARSCNSPGTERNHNLLIANVLEIQSLPGDINLASPGKVAFCYNTDNQMVTN